MRSALTLVLACLSFCAWAIDPVSTSQAVVVQAQHAANASLCEAFKADRSSFGNVMNRQCRDRARADFDAVADRKSLKDCIKPGNITDDDVRKCMKGL